jgi:hypothetical protein
MKKVINYIFILIISLVLNFLFTSIKVSAQSCTGSGYRCWQDTDNGCEWIGQTRSCGLNSNRNACFYDPGCCAWSATSSCTYTPPSAPNPTATPPPPTATPVTGSAWCGNCDNFTCALRTTTQCGNLGYSTAGCTGNCSAPTATPSIIDQAAVGAHDPPNTCRLYGWACDPDNRSLPLAIHIYDNGTSTYVGGTTANLGSEAAVCSGSPNHRFEFNLPLGYRDGVSRTYAAYAIGINSSGGLTGSNPQLAINRQISCAAPTATCSYSGGLTYANFSWTGGSPTYYVRVNASPFTDWSSGPGDQFLTTANTSIVAQITPGVTYAWYPSSSSGNEPPGGCNFALSPFCPSTHFSCPSPTAVPPTPTNTIAVPTPTNYPTWLQTNGGNVTSYSAINIPSYPLNEAFATGVVAANGAINLNTGQEETLFKVTNANLDTRIKTTYSWTELRKRLKNSPVTFAQDSDGVFDNSNFDDATNPAQSGYKYVESTTGTTIGLGGINVGDNRVVLLAHSDVVINGPVLVGSQGNFIVIAQGEIRIGDTVGIVGVSPKGVTPHLAGIFYAGDEFRTGTVRSLRIDGTVVGMNGVIVSRPSTATYPGLYIVYRPDLALRMPPALLNNYREFEEVAP